MYSELKKDSCHSFLFVSFVFCRFPYLPNPKLNFFVYLPGCFWETVLSLCDDFFGEQT